MHRRLSFLGSALAFCFAAPAQDYSIPPNHESLMGSRRGQHLGAFQNLRFQLLSGELQGTNKVHTWNSVSFRREQYGRANTGRSWANVTLAISDHDYSLVGPTFSTNIVGTPTQVFSGTVNYPATPEGGPTTLPPAWGHFAKAGDMTYPFSTPVMHSGKWGVCLDWVMTGGTLANGVPWGATTQRPYYTDGDWQTLTHQDATSRSRITDTTCRATGRSGAPRVEPFFITTAKNSASTKYPSDKLAFEFRATNLQANRPAAGFVSFDRFTAGQTFLSSCEKLYLDLNKPTIPFFFTTDGSGRATTSGVHIPFLPSYTGLRIDTQGVWDDSVKGLQLSGRIFTRARNQADPSKTKRNYTHLGVNNPTGRAGSPYTTLMPCVLLGK